VSTVAVPTQEVPPDLRRWRQDALLRAGFDPGTARQLASDRRVNLHDVLTLVDRGCPPHLAARIVAPL
jgi:hypothetical protein